MPTQSCHFCKLVAPNGASMWWLDRYISRSCKTYRSIDAGTIIADEHHSSHELPVSQSVDWQTMKDATRNTLRLWTTNQKVKPLSRRVCVNRWLPTQILT